MSKYAKGTTVKPNQSLIEIQNLLERYGATGFAFGTANGVITVGFEMDNRRFRFTSHTPTLENYKYKRVNQFRQDERTKAEMIEAQHQANKERWRSLVLVVKAKLESVDAGIETMEQAFLAQLVLPNGQTMGEWTESQIDQMYLTGKMPPLLGAGI